KGCRKFADPARQPLRSKAWCAPEHKMFVVELRDKFHRSRGNVGEALRDRLVEAGARLGKLSVGARGPIDEGGAGPFFKRTQMPADRGMVDRQRLRRAPNSAAGPDRFEGL